MFNTSTYFVLSLSWVVLLWGCQRASQESGTPQVSVPTEAGLASSSHASFAHVLENRLPLVSAHRGGPHPGFPENAIETFAHVTQKIPSIIECDVSMTRDSVLILMHDQTLDRTTTGEGRVADYQFETLAGLRLIDNEGDTTPYKIPTLDDVLAWGKGKAHFTLDVKRGVPFERVIGAIKRFEAASYAAIITYRIEDAKKVHRLHPGIFISVSAGDAGALAQLSKSEIPTYLLLGFVGTREPELSHYRKLDSMGITSILGTLGNLDQQAISTGSDSVYLQYISNGADIIATDRPFEVWEILKTLH